MINQILQKHINKYFPNVNGMTEQLKSFLNEINHSFNQCQEDRDVLNRSIENMRSAELLQKSEANLRTIFDNTDVSYLMLDKEFKIISFNHRAAFGYKVTLRKDLVEGECLVDYLPLERREIFLARYKPVLEGKKLHYQTSFDLPLGTYWFDMNVFPTIDDNNNMYGMIIATEDITERKNTELEKEKMTSDMIQRNKDLEQFAYIISHNLRSPVANIIGLSNMLQNTPSMSKKDYNRCMEGLTLSVNKLDNVIIDLNYILQVRREVSEKKEIVKFSGLTKDITTSIENLIERDNVTIRTNFLDINEFFTIKSYLNSIFYNLILNSIKYRHPDKHTIIEVKSRKNEVGNLVLSFKDNGLGIDMNANEGKIFGLYKKFHAHIEGKGMGLYMVKTQAEILGGKISVKSEVNKGTEFLIEFAAQVA